jgi:hypothetical protein
MSVETSPSPIASKIREKYQYNVNCGHFFSCIHLSEFLRRCLIMSNIHADKIHVCAIYDTFGGNKNTRRVKHVWLRVDDNGSSVDIDLMENQEAVLYGQSYKGLRKSEANMIVVDPPGLLSDMANLPLASLFCSFSPKIEVSPLPPGHR